MKVTEAYPSNFVCAGDLDGREVTLTIAKVFNPGEVKREDGQPIDKAVIYFEQGKRGLVLGKTNARRVQLAHGNEMSKWVGKQITLYPTSTEMAKAAAEQAGCMILALRGKMATVPCIRVKVQGGDAVEVRK